MMVSGACRSQVSHLQVVPPLQQLPQELLSRTAPAAAEKAHTIIDMLSINMFADSILHPRCQAQLWTTITTACVHETF